MTLGYPTSVMVLGLKGQRSRLWLQLTAIRHGFELCEYILVLSLLSVVSVDYINTVAWLCNC